MTPAPAQRADRRDRRRRAARRPARRPRRAAGRGPHRRPVGQHGRRASPTPAGTTCTPPASSAPASRWPRSHARGLLPGRVRLLFQPAEEVMPGGALQLIDAGALDGVDRRLRPALRPQPRRRPGRAPRGPAHRRRRPRSTSGSPARAATPPARTSPRTSPSPSASWSPSCPACCQPPARPARRGQRGLGHGPRRLGPQRHPRHRPWSPAPSGCSTRSPGPTPSTWSASWSTRSWRPTASPPRSTYQRGVPPVVNEHVVHRAARRARSSAVLGDAGHVSTAAEPRRRGLRRGTSTRARGDGPPRHPHAGRADVRPAPGQPAHRRGAPPPSAPGCSPRPR